MGNITSKVDPKGNTTTYAFDALRRPTTFTRPKDAQGNAYSTSSTYDPNGQVSSVVQQVYYPGGNSTQPLGTRTSTNTYDLAGQLTSALDATGNTVSYAYDAAGRTTQTTQGSYITASAYDADGRPTTISAGTSGNLQPIESYQAYYPNGSLEYFCYWQGSSCVSTTFTSDGFNRPARIYYPDGTSETYAYTADDDQDYLSNRAAQTITGSYDALHRLVQKKGDPTVAYSYDQLGRRLSAALANNAGTWTYSYDRAGRLSTTNQPSAGSITYSYDAASNVTAQQVAAQVTSGATVTGGTETARRQSR